MNLAACLGSVHDTAMMSSRTSNTLYLIGLKKFLLQEFEALTPSDLIFANVEGLLL